MLTTKVYNEFLYMVKSWTKELLRHKMIQPVEC